MAKLKFKNGTSGAYVLAFRHPANNKLVHQKIEALSTQLIIDGSVDECSSVRVQYPAIPDNQDVALSDVPYQFIWDNELPELDDYLGSLQASEEQASIEAKEILQQTTDDAIAPLTEESEMTVQIGSNKNQIKSKGKEVQ